MVILVVVLVIILVIHGRKVLFCGGRAGRELGGIGEVSLLLFRPGAEILSGSGLHGLGQQALNIVVNLIGFFLYRVHGGLGFRGIEVLQLRQAPYVQAAQKLGTGRWALFRRHLLPHLLPQFLTGLVLQFPHAILHEASVTFLGFGLPPEQPAVGIILSESMRHLTTGQWWLSLFPGLALVLTVTLFAALGEVLRRLSDPASVHE